MEKYVDQWRILYNIHEHTKFFIIRAEELGFKSYLGPMNELRNAYEHVIRYQTAVTGIQENKNEDYICTNLKKAIGHEYRAFFDAADWLSMMLRKSIIEQLQPYSPTNIRKAIPNYHSDIRPRIDEITEEISKIRCCKDIGNGIDLLPSVEQYYNMLNELLEIYRNLSKRMGCIAEFHEEEVNLRRAANDEKKKDQQVQWKRQIACVIIGSCLTYIAVHSQEIWLVIQAFFKSKVSV
jgi:hypothetical protein